MLGWGNITAYSDRFTITVRGKKTHSARPHKGVDAIAIAAQVITALNGLLLKEIDPLKQATYSIGMIQGGTAPNIIADKVELTGMMRNVTAETRQILAERLKSVSEGIASALGGSAEFTLFEGYPSVYNDPALTDFVAREISAQSARWVSDLAPDLAGQELLIRETQPILGAEDYGFYTQKLPCCFYRVSTGNQAPTHSTRFMVDVYKRQEFDLYPCLFGSLSGLHYQIPTTLADWEIRTEADIPDLIALIRDTRPYLESALDYTRRQQEAGLLMLDIQQVKSYCDGVIEQGEDVYKRQ